MKEIRYVDVTQFNCSAGVISSSYEIIYAGTTIAAMPDSDNNDIYTLLADRYDIRCIFNSNVPVINFYTIPRVDIFAADSNNGYWGTVGESTDINNMAAKICYINNEKEIFIVAENLKDFIFPIDSINERNAEKMNKTEEIIIYSSKEEAEKAVKFLQIPEYE